MASNLNRYLTFSHSLQNSLQLVYMYYNSYRKDYNVAFHWIMFVCIFQGLFNVDRCV